MRPDASSVRRLREFAAIIQNSGWRSMTDPSIRVAHDNILEILDRVRRARDVEWCLQQPEWRRLRDELTVLNAEIHRQTEIELARRYVLSNDAADPFEGSWINKGFGALLSGQVARWKQNGLFRSHRGRIVVVGGGALPQTQIALHRALESEVVSVDRDPVSVDACRAVLRKAGLRRLPVVESDGACYDFSGAYLVVVATLVGGKVSIADRVAATSSDSFFAPRTPLRLHRIWREEMDGSALQARGWRQMDFYAPRGSSVGALLFSRLGSSSDAGSCLVDTT